MSKVSKSIVRERGANEISAFSSFDDFLEPYKSEGTVKSSQDLVSRRPDLLGKILFDWYHQGQVACVFARILAAKRDEKQWATLVIEAGTLNAEQLEVALIEASTKFEALQLIFPGDATALHAVELIRTLCKHPSWTCKEIPWIKDNEGQPVELGQSLQVGLRWHCPNSAYISWVLGIAPFDSMPFTRKFVNAPFIALVLRPMPPTEWVKEKKFESGLEASHLAHMNDTLKKNEELRESFKDRTRRTKFAFLGTELHSTARAKVTFSLPLWCREELGEALTQILD